MFHGGNPKTKQAGKPVEKHMSGPMHPMTTGHPTKDKMMDTGGSGMGGTRNHAPGESKNMGGAKNKK